MTDEQQEPKVSEQLRQIVDDFEGACDDYAEREISIGDLDEFRMALLTGISDLEQQLAAREGDKKRLDTLQEQDYVEFRRAGGKSVVRIWRGDDLRRQLDLWFSLSDPMSSSTPSTDGDSVSMNGETVDKTGYFFGDEYVPDRVGDDEMPEWIVDGIALARKNVATYGEHVLTVYREIEWLADALATARQACHTLECAEAAAMAVALSHEGHIATLPANLTTTVEEAIRPYKERIASLERHIAELPPLYRLPASERYERGYDKDRDNPFPSQPPSPSRPAGGETHE